jgi:hypothetical protein
MNRARYGQILINSTMQTFTRGGFLGSSVGAIGGVALGGTVNRKLAAAPEQQQITNASITCG